MIYDDPGRSEYLLANESAMSTLGRYGMTNGLGAVPRPKVDLHLMFGAGFRGPRGQCLVEVAEMVAH